MSDEQTPLSLDTKRKVAAHLRALVKFAHEDFDGRAFAVVQREGVVIVIARGRDGERLAKYMRREWNAAVENLPDRIREKRA